MRDELDTVGESALVTINVTSNIPEAPLSAKVTDWLKQYGFVPGESQWQSWHLDLRCLCGSGARASLWNQLPDRDHESARGATGYRDFPPQSTDRAHRTNGQCLSRRGGRGYGKNRRIELTSQHTKLGREPSLVDVVFADRSVSRLHPRISEEHEGEYVLYDEGSSSGTYVNFKQVNYDPIALKEGIR